MIPVNHVKKDQNLTVLPGERIPLDGVVTRGHCETDESMLTGESMPVAKSPGSSVLGGTINLYGRLEFRVTHTARETTLSRIIQSVLDAQAKAPIQAFADQVVSIFVPCVLALATFTYLLTLPGHTPEEALIRSVSVLIVACPCALGLATPLAILVGTGIGAHRGILFKGGDIMETAGSVNHVVF